MWGFDYAGRVSGLIYEPQIIRWHEIGTLALVLAVFLFYYFVERRHKLILFKTLATLIVLAVAAAGAVYAIRNGTKPGEPLGCQSNTIQ